MEDDTLRLMQAINRDYQQASGIFDQSHYKIFYSRIDPAPLFVLGINPGGNPFDTLAHQSASKTFYENFEHDYVDCNYAIQSAMLPFLMEILNKGQNEIRKIPKSNFVFRRSSTLASFKTTHGMNLSAAVKECQPFVERMMRHIQPRIILLEGMNILNIFCRHYCDAQSRADVVEPIKTLYRGREVRCFAAINANVACLKRKVLVIAIAHPSYFGKRKEFLTTGSVTKAAKRICLTIFP